MSDTKARKSKNNLLSRAHVLDKTKNLAISRCCFVEEGKEIYQTVKRAYRAVVFAQ